MRLVDADAMKEDVGSWERTTTVIKAAIIGKIDKMPEAVVRCKNCKRCIENTNPEKSKYYTCEYYYDIYDSDKYLVSANDFCSRGEKR